MRTYHRWISSVCMLLLAWVSVTGSLLALDELSPPAGLPGGPAAGPPVAIGAPPLPMDPQVAANMAMRLRWHNLLKELHTGSIIGVSGEALDLATGAAFIVLSVTGIVMYVDMLRARRKIGRQQLFWG